MEWMENNVYFTMFVRMKENNKLNREGCTRFYSGVERLGLVYIFQARLSIYILILASEIESKRMSPNFIGGEYSLSSRGVIKIIKRSKVMRWKSGEP